jgi:hypothetical protein
MRWQIGQASCVVARAIRMRDRHAASFACLVLPLCLVCVALGMAEPAWGQARQHVFLPPAYGATPLSTIINAEAAYVAAYGDMVESVAMARKINAEAAALEIQNAVDYVAAYFKRRELNREGRKKEFQTYLDAEKHRQAVIKERVEKQYQDLLRGDVTSPLNWLLRELSGPVVAYRYLPADQALAHSQLDQTLDGTDLEQIRLTDGGPKGSRLEFTAADGKVLQTPWPLALRGDKCAKARENFERSRDCVVKELQEKSQPSHESQERLLQDVNALFLALEDAYPREKRKDPAEFLNYGAAKRFLQSTLAASHRAITTTDSHVFGGGLRFQGDSVVGLLEHMYQSGLEFAPPQPGGERVYKHLFEGLRTLYMRVGAEQPPAGNLRRPGPAPDAPPGGNEKPKTT